MFSRLPVEVDPLQLADEGRVIAGELPAGLFHRLESVTGVVRVSLHFERLAHGARRMHGYIEARVVTPCQRCLAPVELILRPELDVLLESGGSSGVDEAVMDVLPVEGMLRLADFVEDEMLLAMPMMPVHVDPACEMLQSFTDREPNRK